MSIAVSNKANLKYLIDNEFFITCPFLPSDRFISYCKDRGIGTSKEQLERLEELGILYPIARVKYPKVKRKMEYLEGSAKCRILGPLRDGEEWSGPVESDYAQFWFSKEYASDWLEHGLLWDPSSLPFQKWETFCDGTGRPRIQSFYSVFQCYALYNFTRLAAMEIRAEGFVKRDKRGRAKVVDGIYDWAERVIKSHQETGARGEPAVIVCQIISNRYFPKTQSDRRSIRLAVPGHYHNWNWYEYSHNWDAKAILVDIGLGAAEVKRLYDLVLSDAKYADPLAEWYGLISFASVEEKNRLKGKALLARALYSMEHMLRMFYEDLTGTRLHPPDESPGWERDKFYGKGVTQNELEYLELLTNQYHLNPRPRLTLVVEGNGEAEQLPRLAEKLFGYPFPRLGVEVVNLQGIGSFTGRKREDRYGALERFIDDHHHRQTIVFVVLDREGRALKIKRRLIRTPSRYGLERTVTKDDYIHIWDKNIEFDNFTHEEIARAMTEVGHQRYEFRPHEVAECEARQAAGVGDPLSKLFRKKLDAGILKPELLRVLFESILSCPEKEFDAEGQPKRPVVGVVRKVIELAGRNYRPITSDTWKQTQESGYLGDPSK